MKNQSAATADASSPGAEYWPYLLLLALAAGLRFYRLGAPSLWLDEVLYTWGILQVPWSGFLKTFQFTGVQLPFYFSLVKVVAPLFTSPEIGLRVLSAAADSLGVLAAMAVGRVAGGREGGLFAGWFWAFNPWLVWYAREARPYALSAALSVLLLWLFLRVRASLRARAWVPTFLVLLAGLFTHYFFFLFSGLLIFLALADFRGNAGFFRRWTSLTLAAYLPLGAWIYWFLSQPNPTLGIGWINRPDFLDLPLTIWNLASGYGGQLRFPSALFGATVLVLAIVGLRGRASESAMPRLGFLGIVLALSAVWVVSQRRPIYMDRYFITLASVLLLPACAGARRVHRWLRRQGPVLHGNRQLSVLGAVLLGVGLWSGWQVHVSPAFAREDWRGMAVMLNQHRTDGQEIWLSDIEASLPLSFYQVELADVLSGGDPPTCPEACWWVMRQPYTYTHAFAQGVTDPERPWVPLLPPACKILERWESLTGLMLWEVGCEQIATD